MNKLILMIGFFLISQCLFGQKTKRIAPASSREIKVAMAPDRWDFPSGGVEFLTYKNVPAMKIGAGGKKAIIKGLTFSEGTIEFDVEPILPGFAQSVYFHRKDDKEQEIVYLRVGTIGNKLANEGIQYAPYFDGINMWDMYPQYQGPAPTKKDTWNHLKLVIAGKQMKVYMNDQLKPVLEIPKLEGNVKEGTIAFDGACYMANVTIKPNETEGIDAQEGIDLTNHDANYLRKWAVTKPISLPVGSEANLTNQPKPEEYIDSISAEREGLINLTRKFGGNDDRKLTWLKTNITTKEAIKTNLQLGFSDEVWVFLNNQTVYVDKNLYLQNMRKYPNGRTALENATVNLNLKPGNNELTIAVANDFYGWGIVSRLASMESVVQIDDISGIIELAKEIANLDLDHYLGVYTSSGAPFKLTFTKRDRTLLAEATGQNAVELQAGGNHTFRFDQGGVVFEFKPSEKKMVMKQGSETREFVRE